MEAIRILSERYPDLRAIEAEIEAATQKIIRCYCRGGKLLLCGNGGSCADAAHITGELMKSFALPRPLTDVQTQALCAVSAQEGAAIAAHLQQGLPAIDLSAHIALTTAFSNDVNPALCFAQQAFTYAQPQDILLGLSTCGNADNVIKAGVAAKAKGAFTVGLTGIKPCKMDGLFDIVIHAPAQQTYRIQEYHLPIYHAMCRAVEAALFGGDAQ